MASLVNPHPAFWRGRRVLLTGHTGFKGAWLWHWLEKLGADVIGFAQAPEGDPNLAVLSGITAAPNSVIGDIRDRDAVRTVIEHHRPGIILHLAAQALVRRSYAMPLETIATNVLGTANVLDAARGSSVKAIVSVTTDKCYHNREWVWPYREDEPLGGADPYSASKACAELVSAAWRQSFLAADGVAVATARAGNVIGGGDWSVDRLVPDCLASMAAGIAVAIRNPAATRPWQHVLEPLAGYLLLAERLVTDGAAVAEPWNFGPEAADVEPVCVIADRLVDLWGGGASWLDSSGGGPHEAGLLAVDASKAKARLGWRPRLPIDSALAWTVDWHRAFLNGTSTRALVDRQIDRYIDLSF